jgi:DNA-binding response OmpR family regulator
MSVKFFCNVTHLKVVAGLFQMTFTTPSTSPQNTVDFEPRVLLVDDDSSLLRLHQIMLGKFLSTPFVDCVDNALDAMLHLELLVPDLVIADLNMPGIDGFNLLNLLESDARYAGVARVALSGLDAREVRRGGGVPLGVMVLQKPLDFRKIVQIQVHLLEQQKRRGEKQPEQRPPEPHAAGDGAMGSGPAPRKKILVVDDNPDIRQLLTITLSAEFDVLEAPDGESGLHALYQHHPKLVFLDIMLPGELNGLQLLEMIRTDQAHRDTWVGVISALGQQADCLAGQANGANAYFVKPFSPQQLLDWCRSKLA